MRTKILIGLLVFLLIAGGIAFLALNASFSEGFRSGRVVKMSKKGLVFKTYEGELLLTGGLYNKNTAWQFSVPGDQPDIIKKIEDAADKGHRVKLQYEEKYFKQPWKGDTKYFIINVEDGADEPEFEAVEDEKSEKLPRGQRQINRQQNQRERQPVGN